MNDFVYLIYVALSFYAWAIVIGAILSWSRPRPGTMLSQVDRVISQVTEPYVGLFRRLLPMARLGGLGIDLSPVVALVVLSIVIQVLVRL